MSRTLQEVWANMDLPAEGECAYDYFIRANARAELGRHEEALDDYNRVVTIDPRYGERDGMPGMAWYNRGNTLLALNRLASAAESYDQGLQALGETEPEFAAAILANRAAAMHILGRTDEAVKNRMQAASLDPSPKRDEELAGAMIAAGNPTGAERFLAARQDKEPDEPIYSVLRAAVLLRMMNDPSTALQIVSAPRVASILTDNGRWWQVYLACLIALGRRADATAGFDQVVALHPDWRPALVNEFGQSLGIED